MKHTLPLISSLGVFAFLAAPTQDANADITMVAQELNGGVVITYTGSLRISELAVTSSYNYDRTAFGSVDATYPAVEFAPSNGGSSFDLTEYWDVISSRPSSIGSRSSSPSTFTGDYFYIGFDDLGVPDNYTDNEIISGSMTFSGATFASMGLTPTGAGFPFVWIFENGEQATLQIGDGTNNAAAKDELDKKIKKLKAKLKKAKRGKKKKKVKKLKGQLKDLKSQLNAL